jgi:polar amino acid transport system permease protein
VCAGFDPEAVDGVGPAVTEPATTWAAQGGSAPPSTDEAYEEIRAVPVRHWGRWVAAILLVLLAAMMIRSMILNPGFQWGVVRQYFAVPLVLSGIRITLTMTVCAMAIGLALGTVLAILRLSPNPVLSSASSIYIWFFRGTPVLVQLIIWYNLGALYPRLSLGIPFGHIFVSASANSLITPFTAGLLGLGLNEAAYMAEIVRGGILAVPSRQVDASMAVGLSRVTMMRRIILPQAMRSIIPPTGNEVIGMLKWTSIVSVIALADVLYSVQLIYARTYQTIPLLIVACLWYLIMTTVLSVGQHYVERYFARGTVRRRTSVFRRLFTDIGRTRRFVGVGLRDGTE